VNAVLLLAFLVVACATPIAELSYRGEGDKAGRLFIVNHGWHSGIVMKKADIPEGVLPEVNHFLDAEYLEIGWGDWDYYQAPNPGLGLALKAAFWSSRSVLYVAGFEGAVKNYFPESEVNEIVLSDEAFQRLIQFISGTFSRSDAAAPVKAEPGPYPNSRFYSARGKFHFFRTCNTWVAEALRSAGLPITPAYAVTAGNLSYQIKRLGAVKKDP
jgi:uncharacterized protein (TIGR02117 family)